MTIDIGSNLAAVLMALIAALGSFVAAFFAFKANTNSTSTHSLVDGKMTELLTVSKDAARAQGVIAGLVGDTNAQLNGSKVTPTPVSQLIPPTG